MSTPTTIAFVTSNPGKVTTASEHLHDLGIELEQVALDLEEIQSCSVHEVALYKAQQAFHLLRRPLIVEDSGFYIDELNGFPGPLVKHLIKSLGAEGLARLADLTSNRHCHFEGVLVYVDARGMPEAFIDKGEIGTVAHSPAADPEPGAWSALWDVFIPPGSTQPLSALRDDARTRVLSSWARHSVFARFGEWVARRRAVVGSENPPAVSRLVSGPPGVARLVPRSDSRRLAGFAADQASYIKARLGLASNDELAQVNVIKLAEEAGEVANAFLALHGLQRDDKLNGSPHDRLQAVAKEIGDVVATVSVLAHALGFNVDDLVSERIRELSERRQRWMESQELTDP